MEFIWSCMVISLKGFLGTIFWFIALIVAMLVFAIIGYLLFGDWYKKDPPEKPKYKGKPIVIKGGYKDAK